MSRIISATRQKDKIIITLSSTNFFCGGGGQPPDNGFLVAGDTKLYVEDIKKTNEGAEFICTPVEKTRDIKEIIGKEAREEINLNRRKLLSRMHSGGHLYFKALEKILGRRSQKIEVVKIRLGEQDSVYQIKTTFLDYELLIEAEKLANRIIKENRKIKEHIIKKSEFRAEDYPELRIKLERIKNDSIRIIEIENFDWSACSGTHVNSTKEIGNLLVTRYNKKGELYEIHYTVEPLNKLYEYAEIIRKLSDALEIDDGHIYRYIINLNKSAKEMKEKLRSAGKEILNNLEKIADNAYFKETKDIDSKIIQKEISKKELPLVIILNKKHKTNQLLIFSKTINAKELLNKITDKQGGKGGGNEKFAAGSVSDPENLKQIIKEVIG